MKYLLLILSCFVVPAAGAQNWQCMQPGRQVYFTNHAHYLRAMRVDSVRTDGPANIYYPYHSPRGKYTGNPAPLLDTAGGSWLGSKIIQQADGTTMFDNIWKDTIVIRTQAATGQSWVFYNDTTARYYEATVSREDTLTVNNIQDSVKHLQITAKIGGQTIPDLINTQTIILSKNNGLVQVFDLVTFPYHEPATANSGMNIANGLDYYLDIICRTGTPIGILFKRIAFYNPDSSEIYDYQPGDMKQYDDYRAPFASTFSGASTDSVVSRQMNGSFLLYNIKSRKVVVTNPNPVTYSFYNSNNNLTLRPGSQPLLDTLQLPEEWLNQTITYYNPADTGYCFTALSIKLKKWTGLQPGGHVNNFEVIESERWYKAGLGLVKEYQCMDPINFCFDKRLSFTKRNGISCGSYTALSIAQPVQNEAYKIFPNPARGEITIKSESRGKRQVTLINMQGSTLMTITWNNTALKLDISSFPSGIYLLQITSEAAKVNRTITIQ